MRQGVSALVGQELRVAHRGSLRQRGSVRLETVDEGARHVGHDCQIHAASASTVVGPPGEAAPGFEVIFEGIPPLHGREVRGSLDGHFAVDDLGEEHDVPAGPGGVAR